MADETSTSESASADSQRSPVRATWLPMLLMIVALCCFAFESALVFATTHHYLDDLKVPNAVAGFLFLAPLIVGVAALIVLKRLSLHLRP